MPTSHKALLWESYSYVSFVRVMYMNEMKLEKLETILDFMNKIYLPEQSLHLPSLLPMYLVVGMVFVSN